MLDPLSVPGQRFVRTLQTLLGLIWQDKVPHAETFLKSGIYSVEACILCRLLSRLCHVIHVLGYRFPKMVFFRQIETGCPKIRFYDRLKRSHFIRFLSNRLEVLAVNWKEWRSMRDPGVECFEVKHKETAWREVMCTHMYWCLTGTVQLLSTQDSFLTICRKRFSVELK